MNAYIVLALLIGARTEELRALTWDRLDLDGDPPYRKELRPVITRGARAINELFDGDAKR